MIWFTKEEALLFRRRRRRQFRQFRKLFRILSDFLKMDDPTLRTAPQESDGRREVDELAGLRRRRVGPRHRGERAKDHQHGAEGRA